MTFTCPYCHSEARLTPNPAHAQRASLPLYLITCTGCARTHVSEVPARVK